MSNEELQTGLAPEPTNVDAVSDTAMGENQEQNIGAVNNDVAQTQSNDPQGFTKRMNKKHHELMEERREKEALQAQLSEMQSQIPTAQRPDVPDMPDVYDDNFDEQVRLRDKAIQDAAMFDAQQRLVDEQRARQDLELQEEQQRAHLKIVQDYSSRAAKQNISKQELEVAGQTVMAYGIGDELTGFILNDEHGPLITKYLAQNPEEIESMRGMGTMNAAIHIANNVKPKAVSNLTNNVPSPADTLGGGGAPKRERGPTGATYT